ncbi:UPF0280 family protein [Mangrovibacterium sp.]|uniref:UPF0280 family protein n=1 Tax=Mangrovibacterium sp. TaxID=1961364 RepID=UPI0035635DB7
MDLWIGVDPKSFQNEMVDFASTVLKKNLEELDAYTAEEPFFKKSLKPCAAIETAPEVAKMMAHAGELASAGPMAAKAGIFCELVGKALTEKFEIGELILENEGDLYIKLQNSLIVSIFAGESDVSGLIGIEIQPEQTPLGVGTAAGKIGTPMMHGKADAILIVARNAAVAGAFAVGLGNLIKKPGDVDKVLKRTEVIPEVEAAVLVFDDQIGLRGEFELKMIG